MEIGREHCRTCKATSKVRFKRSHRRLSIAPFEIWNVVCKHVWKPKVDTFSTWCDGHVFNMKQGTCVINFMLLNVLVGKLYRHFRVRKLAVVVVVVAVVVVVIVYKIVLTVCVRACACVYLHFCVFNKLKVNSAFF
jgi:hypothetical protein